MANIKNYIDVLIDGKIYSLMGNEDEQYLQKIAAYVNDKLIVLKKQEGFSKQSSDYQAVMTELNIADDFFRIKEQYTKLEAEKLALEKETYSLKHELISLQMEKEKNTGNNTGSNAGNTTGNMRRNNIDRH